MKRILLGATLGALLGSLFVQAQTQVTTDFPRCADGQIPIWSNAQSKWVCGDQTGGEGGDPVPPGAILILTSGTCPSGYSEVSELAGRTLIGTLAGNSDAGTTGGNDSITPQGTNSGGAVSAHAGTAVADHASHTHTYSQVVNHTHPLATGTTATGNFAQVIGTVDTSSGGTGGTPTQTALGTLSGNPSGGVASGTTAGPSATLTHGVTQPSNHSFTQPTFSGTAFDNRSSFVRCIFCRKN